MEPRAEARRFRNKGTLRRFTEPGATAPLFWREALEPVRRVAARLSEIAERRRVTGRSARAETGRAPVAPGSVGTFRRELRTRRGDENRFPDS